MDSMSEVKQELDDTGDVCFVESGIVPLDDNAMVKNEIKTEEDMEVSSSSSFTIDSSSCNSSIISSPSSNAIGESSRVNTSSCLSSQAKAICPRPSTLNPTSAIIGNLTSRVILPRFPVPQSNINTSIVTNMNTNVVSSLNASGVPNINTSIMSTMNAGGVSSLNTTGVSNMNTSGVVTGGAPSLMSPATFILLPPSQLQSEPVQISRDVLPIPRNPTQIPREVLAIPRDPSQIPREVLPIPRDPTQIPKEPLPKSLPKNTLESRQITLMEPKDVSQKCFSVEMDMDIAKSLYVQSLALNRLAIVVAERNLMLEKFITAETGHREKLMEVLEQSNKEQEEIRLLVKEQNSLVQEQLRQQREQMFQVLEIIKSNQEHHHKEMQTLKQQVLSMQQQMMQWAQDWTDQQKQQAVQHEILDLLKNMQQN